ncbi:MAG: EamA family transporter [Candidatus Pacebacteria bacterium]|nr:EamA family transporter [Candidatus Paceibacterota bacterium]
MIWLFFAILTAISNSLKGVFGKKCATNVDVYIVSWCLRFFGVIFLLPVLFFLEVPILGDNYWIALLIGGSLNTITTILFIKALKYSDLSIVSPIAAFTPLFLLVTSPLITGEFPTLVGLIGVMLIIFGSYLLNIIEIKNGYLEPLRALFKERGAKLMFIVAFIWSITSNIDKIGVQNSSPIFWVFSINAFIAIVLLPIAILKFSGQRKKISKNIHNLVLIGFLTTLTLVFQMIAISLALVIYVIAIKRTSAIFSVFWGHYIFKEKNMKNRLLGSIIMVIGVILIVFT